MYIIVGLGNPEEKYKKTRHNAGFMAVDFLAEKLELSWKKNKKFFAEIAKPPLPKGGEGGFILVKPQTFMNNSGQAVQTILKYYKIIPSPETLIVIHDDLDIELGKYKISVDSRAGGHNGVQSIIGHLKTKNFKRIRLGIKTEEKEKIGAKNFVLKNFSKEEKKIINKVIDEIIEKLRLFRQRRIRLWRKKIISKIK